MDKCCGSEIYRYVDSYLRSIYSSAFIITIDERACETDTSHEKYYLLSAN